MKLFSKYKQVLASFLFLFVITVLFFYPLFLHPNEVIFPAYDFFGIFYYEKLFFIKSVMSFHQIPLWNPFVFSGTPFLANPTTAVFYPTTLLFLLFPTLTLFGFLFCLDIFLAGLFTYIYCKSLGLEIFPSLLSSITFMFSGILIALYIPGHLVVLDTIIWFPLLLYLINKLVEKQRFTIIAFLGLIVALTIFAGHIQISFYSLVFASFYFLFLLFIDFLSKNRIGFTIKTLVSFLLSLLIGIGISSVQLLPSLEFASFSSRALGVSFEFASSFSIHPYQLLTTFLPHFFGDNYIFWGKANFSASSIYIGIIPLFFVFFSFIKRSKYTLFFSTLTIFTFIYATGENMPLFPALFAIFPKLNSFRVPSRTLYFFVFSLSVMSGFGVKNFLSIISPNINLIKKVALGMTVGVITLLTIIIFMQVHPNSLKLFENIILRNSFAQGMDHYYIYNLFKNDLLTFSTITVFLTITLLLLMFKKINKETFKILIMFLALSDLFIFGQALIQTINPTEMFKIDAEKKIILDDKSLYRVFSMEGDFQGVQDNLIPNATGVHSLYLKSLENFIYKIGPHLNQDLESFFIFSEINNLEVLRLLNVKYIVARKSINNRNLRLIYLKNGAYLYELINTYPRTYFSDTKSSRGYFIPNQSAYIEITSHTPNKIKLRTYTTTSGKVILSEVNYPGWKAFIDSKEVDIQTHNDIFRSINVSKGKHKIEFVYDPFLFKLGALISGFTIILVSISFIILKKVRLDYAQLWKRKNKMSTFF